MNRDEAAHERPRPGLFRVLARALVAGVLVEAAVVGLLAAAWTALHGAPLPLALLAWAGGAGLGAGAAFGLAEAVTGRFGAAAGLVAGALAAGLALAGGELAVELVRTGSSVAATQAVLAWARGADPLDLGVFVAGAVALHAPLVAARRSAAGARRQAVAAAIGLGLVGLVALAAPVDLDGLPVAVALVALLPRAALLPLGLRLGDAAARAALRVLGQPCPGPAPARRALLHLAAASVLLALAGGCLGAREDRVATWVLRARGALGSREALVALGDRCAHPPATRPRWTRPLWLTRALASVGVAVPWERYAPGDARAWYARAAVRGHADAWQKLAAGLHGGWRHDAARPAWEALLRSHAAAGDPGAMCALGEVLVLGWTKMLVYDERQPRPWGYRSWSVHPAPPAPSAAQVREGLAWLDRAAELGLTRARIARVLLWQEAGDAEPALALARSILAAPSPPPEGRALANVVVWLLARHPRLRRPEDDAWVQLVVPREGAGFSPVAPALDLAVNRCLVREPRTCEGPDALGDLLARGRDAEARARAEDALRRDPLGAAARNALSLVWLRAARRPGEEALAGARLEHAEAYLHDLTQRVPEHVDAATKRNLALIYLWHERGRPASPGPSVYQATLALALDPDDAAVRELLGAMVGDARSRVADAAGPASDLGQVLRDASEAALSRADEAAAAVLAGRALQLDREDAEAWLARGWAHLAARDAAVALADARAARRAGGRSATRVAPRVALLAACALVLLGDLGEARRELEALGGAPSLEASAVRGLLRVATGDVGPGLDDLVAARRGRSGRPLRTWPLDGLEAVAASASPWARPRGYCVFPEERRCLEDAFLGLAAEARGDVDVALERYARAAAALGAPRRVWRSELTAHVWACARARALTPPVPDFPPVERR